MVQLDRRACDGYGGVLFGPGKGAERNTAANEDILNFNDHSTRMIVRVRAAVESPADRSHRHEENHDKALERLSIGDCAARSR